MWFKEAFKSVMGQTPPQPPAGAAAGAAAEAEPAHKTDKAAEAPDWRDGMNQYFVGVRSTLGGGGEGSGFAIIDKVLGRDAAGHGGMSSEKKDIAFGRGNAVQELAEIEAQCNALSNPSLTSSSAPSDDEIWKEWLHRIDFDREDRFYDADADELLSFHQLLISSPAISCTVKRVLQNRKDASPTSPAMKFLQACLVGEGHAVARTLSELVRLGQVLLPSPKDSVGG